MQLVAPARFMPGDVQYFHLFEILVYFSYLYSLFCLSPCFRLFRFLLLIIFFSLSCSNCSVGSLQCLAWHAKLVLWGRGQATSCSRQTSANAASSPKHPHSQMLKVNALYLFYSQSQSQKNIIGLLVWATFLKKVLF